MLVFEIAAALVITATVLGILLFGIRQASHEADPARTSDPLQDWYRRQLAAGAEETIAEPQDRKLAA